MPRPAKGEKRICVKCGELKGYHNNRYGYCQKCYKEYLDRYRYYDYKCDVEQLGWNEKRIVKYTVEEGLSKEEIANRLGLNKEYVRQVIKRNTKRVDIDGKEEGEE